MASRVRAAGVAVLAVAALPAAACSYGSSSREPTMTLDAAKQHMDQTADQIVAGMPVKPRLTPHGGLSSVPCDGGLAGSPSNVREEPSIGYFLDDVPEARNPEVFAFIQAFAAQHGFKPFTSDSDFATYKDKDGFGIKIQQAGVGSKGLSLGLSGPCIWPNGTPPPKG